MGDLLWFMVIYGERNHKVRKKWLYIDIMLYRNHHCSKFQAMFLLPSRKNNYSKRWRCCQHSSGWFPLAWPSLNIIWLVVEPPLWKIWVQSVGVIIPIYMERHKIPWFQSPPTSHSLRKTQTDLPENLTECGCQVSHESQPYRGTVVKLGLWK